MKRLFLFIAILFLSACKPKADVDLLSLRYDGVYVNVTSDGFDGSDGQVFNYLRFYENGQVIGTGTTGDFNRREDKKKLLTWFRLESETVEKGEYYQRKDGYIEFLLKSGFPYINEKQFGDLSRGVEYKGHVLTPKLHFQIFSHINGHKDELVYEFLEISELQ